MDRSLAGYSPWGRKEMDTTKLLTLPLYSHCPAAPQLHSCPIAFRFFFFFLVKTQQGSSLVI